MKRPYPTMALVIFTLFAGSMTLGKGDCEKKREDCIESCQKQRNQCDAAGNSSDYCVKQDQRCQKGCEDAWRKCNEKP